MKKIIYALLIIIIFVLGLRIGSKETYNKNKLIDEAKSKFEEEIVTPENHYETIDGEYEENIFNKSAEIIDELIQKVVNKFKEKR